MNQQAQQPHQRPRPTFRTVQVSRVSRLTPNLVRVTFTGEELTGFATRGPAEHIRVWFPFPGEEKPIMPAWGPNGPELAPGQRRPISRVYTPRRWDPAARELDVDFVLHREGPGMDWVRGARPGSTVVVSGPAGAYQVDPEAGWYVIAGDHAALPAIATIAEVLPPSTRVHVLIEVESPAEQQPIDSRAQLAVTWLYSGADGERPGHLLAAAIRDVTLPDGNGRVWVACEATVMRDIRRHLLYERGLERGAIYTHGYWKRGEANHPDHDFGDDV